MKNNTKPGSNMIQFGILGAFIGVIFCIIGASSTDRYGYHMGPAPLAILIVVASLILAAIGFAKRLLAALENKGES